ncbi:hypothetical protein PSEHALCIP103_03643 [Pseudoalteromonas haloplanktis]|jgi:hypothetical protein|uniref:Uncharacterized protein n=1 Tax=Pseudoalteromonas haloplanktis TaxID=228 RepID=A0A9W4R4N8_PSEHA|nr:MULTISPECIES: hypothetical protein [Pseudoalteromonas]MBB1352247.1 hypothetical protein [Pseudoalteromonas sp. SG45-3]MBB1359824.1 hypothetical protein [Pseudoalteromonas sp. SG45-6]CAH9066710.1 hypothetical protein PSEHALCIP103_03643 [Pseudoalteromonas haloplanktis]|tara:strand:- start:171 stop:1385 length:1215 start_codon:yes stop_codon:yes gene_type:complete
MSNGQELIPSANVEIIEASGVNALLLQIRPHWQAKNLIQRVTKLLHVDPSSACQRLFNASIHDLREKILFAGVDIAAEAAKQHKLPPISSAENVENYSTLRMIDLAYRMGLLSRPEYRRILRAYDIRKDLEHEDDEYEAGVEDCVYIFRTCVDVILSKDPIELIKLTDIKEIVERSEATTLNESLLEEFSHAPEPRQMEIYKFLISSSLNVELPDVVRHNCYMALYSLKSLAHSQVMITCAREFVKRIGKRGPTLIEARVAYGAGLLPYLKQAQIKDFYDSYFDEMKKVGYSWGAHNSHGELLRNLEEIGGLEFCPEESLGQYVEWLVLCYIGSSGGRTSYGNVRNVFYSNVGAPIAINILKAKSRNVYPIVADLEKGSKSVRYAVSDEHVARRFNSILDELEP